MTHPATDHRAAALHDLPIELRVCVGRARPLIGQMLTMAPDTVLPLDRRVEDRVLLYVGEKAIAEGELIEQSDGSGQLAVRITQLIEGGRPSA